ncbi:hypothetical protein SJDPG2_00155 [Porphyromonas gingivalis SJD2]|nr:hypothetical protein A343_2382 [Porphyromonas gingivalis JCVI SC001]ERJ81883.1 hypothetical protein HMPREF1989_02331 [Porphyromonas gingivalis F0566]ETA27822.1 hypothetical protein SJDPG2_00155 [Porphyromonas gingivalis SJD2]OWR76888.1 hypothetical protein SJDPG5_01280 [Porphyromonas gingivalis SJD5]
MLSSNKDNYGDHCIEFQDHEFYKFARRTICIAELKYRFPDQKDLSRGSWNS